MNKVQSTWKLNRHLLRKKWWDFYWEGNEIKKAKLNVCSFPPFQFPQPFSREFSIKQLYVGNGIIRKNLIFCLSVIKNYDRLPIVSVYQASLVWHEPLPRI
ncbi:hypothetical protein TorRG33x02_130230, partial [Trema orientale]